MTTTTIDPLTANTGSDFIRAAIANIDPHPENPRRVDDDHPSLPGLAQSIRETGLINPLTVRQVGSRLQILAGERRWRAAKKAGLVEVLVRVVDVTDEQAFHIITVENLQREDLHWTEEARGVEAMLAKGWPAESIAKAVGRTVQWVALRKALLALSPAWKKDLANPKSDWHDIPLNKLELIARLPHEAQDRVHHLGHWQIHEWSVKQFAEHLDADYTRKLSKAPFEVLDASLVPKAGACTACPKRSSCQQQLFDNAKDDRCLDATCWKAKQDAHVLRVIQRQQHAEPKTIILKDGYVDDQAPEVIKKAGYLHAYDKVAKSDAGAVPAIIANGASAGRVVYVKPQREYRGSSAIAKPAGPKSVKDRVAALGKRRANAVVLSFSEHMEKEAERMPPVAVHDALKLFTLCVTWGVKGAEDRFDPIEGGMKRLARLRAGGTQLLEEAWQAVAPVMLEAVGYQYRAGNPPLVGVEMLCAEFGWLDLLAKWKRQAELDVPMPRALADDLALAEATKKAPKPKAAADGKARAPAKSKAAAAAAKS